MLINKKRILAVLCICLLLGTGFAYAAVQTEVKAIQSTISMIFGKKVESITTLTYKGEVFVPLKKAAALLNKNVVLDTAKGKAVLSDKAVVKPLALIKLKSGETITVELYREIAPITVDNFIKLSKSGFYNGLTFHRVIEGFMIQGGDPAGNGTGGPGYKIKGEFMKNGVSNGLLHEKGVISMARTSDPDSAGSQFFIMLAANNSLNGEYAAFGKVIKGIEAVEKIGLTQTDEKDKPIAPQVIESITIK